MLNKYVFRNLVQFDVNGIVLSIEERFFANLKKIKVVSIQSDNLAIFFNKGLKWLDYLNEGVNANLTRRIIRLAHNVYINFNDRETLFKRAYEWPDKDFCLFKNFLHSRLVYPIIFKSKQLECSCTLTIFQILLQLGVYDVQ
jgi:hypothetical protein